MHNMDTLKLDEETRDKVEEISAESGLDVEVYIAYWDMTSETGQILDDLGEFQEFDTLHGALVALGERKTHPTNKEKTTWRMKISSMMRTLLS